MQAAGDDGAVRKRAAGAGHHGEQLLARQFGKLGRGDVVGDQDFAGEAQLAVVRAAVQGGMHAADHVVEIIEPRAEVVVVHRLEHRGKAITLQFERVVGRVAPGVDQVPQAGAQLGVVKDQHVQVEELADLLRQRALQFFA